MKLPELNEAEWRALVAFVNLYVPDVPDDQVSDDLRSAAAKIEAWSTFPSAGKKESQ